MNLTHASFGALFLADNLALDFINTEYGVDDRHQDSLTDDKDVESWLELAGILRLSTGQKKPAGLLDIALELRKCLRAVVSAAINGVPVDVSVINQMLEAGRPISRLEWDDEVRAFRVATQQRDMSPASLLAPVAESLVGLVTGDKFEFVRQCEAQDCELLFHDLTKSHRRRWCSMATCGNRMKVAAFRSRKKT